jgi:hypothetical protein
MSPQKKQRQCPLSPDDRKIIQRKSECTPVIREKNVKNSQNIVVIQFPEICENTVIFSNQWKRKRVTFTAPTIAEYEKNSQPKKLIRYTGAPVKEKYKRFSYGDLHVSKQLFSTLTVNKPLAQTNLFRFFPGNAPKKPSDRLKMSHSDARQVRKNLWPESE